jgi:hypothetical protein
MIWTADGSHHGVMSATTGLEPPSRSQYMMQFEPLSQAGFIERWCLNNVLAEVSSGADGSAVVRVHVPPLNAVTVPVAT